jgi:hypothetical protein
MKNKFKITEFSPPPPPKMKKKNRFTIKELLQLQKNKKRKTKILQNVKKRGFITAELSPQLTMRKKIKNNIIVGRRFSPPKKPKTKFIIEDIPSPPKQPIQTNLTKTRFIIEDIPSPPKQPRSSSTSSVSSSISSSSPLTPCCNCKGTRSVQTNTKCVWCQLHYHLKKCVSQNAKERKKLNKQGKQN